MSRPAIGSGTCLALVSGILLAFIHTRLGECVQSFQTDSANVTASVSQSEVQVAEPFILELNVTAPAGSKVRLPAVGERLGEFDVIDHHDLLDIPSDFSPGHRSWNRRLTLESIVTGYLEIPAMEIQITSGANPRALQSDVIAVHVISVLENRADPTRFRDIHTVVDASVPDPNSRDWVWWTAGGLGLLMLGAAAVAVVMRRKSWLTPDEWALRKLAKLQESTAMQAGDGEAVICELSAVVGDFLKMQFELVMQVNTADELLQVIETGGYLERDLIHKFSRLFANADLVKFAGMRMTNDEVEKLINEAVELIAATSSGSAARIERNSNMDTLPESPNPSEDTVRVV